MSSLLLLGPQRPHPNAPAALATVPGDGPVVTITAGWRHDETDDEALRRHLGPDVSVLPLYGWFEIVMRQLPELRAAYRARQDRMLRMARLHRGRLDHANRAARALLAEDHDAAGTTQLELAMEDVRRIDQQLLQGFAELRSEVASPDSAWLDHPLIEGLRDKAVQALEGARAIVLTGGHVAVLRNRLAFFGIDDALRAAAERDTPLIAWSAGAMVLTERVVLYYDDPPEGPSVPEILDQGIGLLRDLVLFPHARQRLRLDQPRRVELLASRFAPAACVALENGAWLADQDGVLVNRGAPGTATVLQRDGRVIDVPNVEGVP